MALLTGHMTKLEAVNELLFTIGERPVNSLSSGLAEASQAEDILDRVSRQIQMKGWHCNTLFNYQLTPNASNQFALPDNTLKVDTVNPQYRRSNSTPSPSSYINVSMRRAADDTKWIMWDNDNGAETITDVTSMTVELVQLLEFANLTPALQIYVWTAAAHRYQQGTVGSAALDSFSVEDVQNAMADAVNEDFENSDANIINDNPHVAQIAKRRNRGAGT
jgi:hypothetical protein